VLRVHFTADDLLRTRFAAAPAPLMELGLAVAALQRRDPVFAGWRRTSMAALPPPARPLLQLVPPSGAGPRFLDPVSDGLDDGLAGVLAAPTPFVRRELRRVCGAGQPVTPWVRALYERDRRAWWALRDAVRSGFEALISSDWPRICRAHHADVAWRARMVGEYGLQAALQMIHPRARWRGTTLEVDVERDLTVAAGGCGVTLLPTVFGAERPLIDTHPDGSLLIVYPALTPLPLIDDSPTADPLGELLGRTRAAVLELAAAPHSTSELARELGISAATVSQHTRTLRGAGLLATERAGKAVLHTITPLGDRVLAATGQPRQTSTTVPNPRRS
jgi:DNA-binding transcriptional ArsR family regulator